METQAASPQPQRSKKSPKKLKRYAVAVKLHLTRAEAVAMRERSEALGLKFQSWATRVCLEEMARPARLPAKDAGQKAA